ncbi:NurA domain protein [compost metagenome]
MLDSVPADMVAKLLERGYEVARGTAARASAMAENRARIRASLDEHEAIFEVPNDVLDDADLRDDEVSAVDGAFICDNQNIGDLCTAVAVSVGPRDGQGSSDVFMENVPRNATNKELTAGVMAAMELLAASASDAKVVLVDGSMLSGLITLSKAIYSAGAGGNPLTDRVLSCASHEVREAACRLLSDRKFVALPKYTTTNELARWLPSEFHAQDGKILATMALRPGEMTHWIEKSEATRNAQRSVGRALGCDEAEDKHLKHLMEEVVSCYYRPHPWTQALRLDVARTTSEDPEATTMIIKAIRDSTLTSGILEPFPLYLVDQYAKQISNGAAPMVSMAAMANLDDDDAQIMLAMRYRS